MVKGNIEGTFSLGEMSVEVLDYFLLNAIGGVVVNTTDFHLLGPGFDSPSKQLSKV